MINFVDYYIHYTERLRHINNAVRNAPAELIRQMEEQYSKRIDEIADFVMSSGSGRKLIMMSGPSSSGKTTTANMLVSRVKASGAEAVCLSLDDFFKGEGQAPQLPDGTYDYESVYALDVELMQSCLTRLLEEGRCMMPRFDFAAKSPAPERYPLEVGDNDVIIVEGIHALNPMITDCLPDDRMVKIYISVKQGIKEGDEVVISAHQIRFLRRLVRDYQFRSSPPERTFEMWPQVLRGEKLYISAYKRLATVTINSIHIYEVNAIADKAIEILSGIPESSPYYAEAQEYIGKLALFENLDEGQIPEKSLIREFIGQGRLSDRPSCGSPSGRKNGRRVRAIREITLFADSASGQTEPSAEHGRFISGSTLAPVVRLTMALNSRKFSLARGWNMADDEKIDGMQLNFTMRLPEGHSRILSELPAMKCAGGRTGFVGVGVSQKTFEELDGKSGQWFLNEAVKVLTAHFCGSEEERNVLYSLLADITAQGGGYEILYISKKSAALEAGVYAKVDDSLMIIPRLEVTDRDGNVILNRTEEPVERDVFAARYGSLMLNGKELTVRPRAKGVQAGMNELRIPLGEKA